MAAKKKPLWTNSTLIVVLTIASVIVAIATAYSSFSSIDSVTDKDRKLQRECRGVFERIDDLEHATDAPPEYAKLMQQHNTATYNYVTPNLLFYPAPIIKAKRMPIAAEYLGNMNIGITPDFDKITLSISLADVGQYFTRIDPNSKREENYPHVDPDNVTIEVRHSDSQVWEPADKIGDNEWRHIDNRDIGQAERQYDVRAKAEFPNAETMPDDTDNSLFKNVDGKLTLTPTAIEKKYPQTVQAITKRRYDIILRAESAGKEKANLKIVDRQTEDVPEMISCMAGDGIGKTPYTVLCVVNLKGGKIEVNDAGLIERIILNMEIYGSKDPEKAGTITVEYYNDILAPNRMTNSEMIKGALAEFRTKLKPWIGTAEFNANETGLMEKCLTQAAATVKQLQTTPTQFLSQTVREFQAASGIWAGKSMLVGEVKGVNVGENETIIVHYAPAEGYQRLDNDNASGNKLLYYAQIFNKTKQNQYRNALYGPYVIEIGGKATTTEAVIAEISKDIDFRVASKNFASSADKASGSDKPVQTKTDYVPMGYAEFNFYGIPNALGNFVIYSDLSARKPLVYYAPETPDATTTQPTGKTADEMAREEIVNELDQQVTTARKDISNVTIAEALDHLTANWPRLKGDTNIDPSMEDIEDVRFDITLDDRSVTGKVFLEKIVESLNAKLEKDGRDIEVTYEIGAKIVLKAQKK